MSKAIELLCPNCETIASCEALETFRDLSSYKFRQFFEGLTGKEGNFRLRTRQCVECEEDFTTVEIDETVLNLIKDKLESLKTTVNSVSSELDKAYQSIYHINETEAENSLADKEAIKVKRYVKFVFRLTGIKTSVRLGLDAKLNEYFSKNDAEPFIKSVDEMLKSLSFREREIIKMRFGLGEFDSENKRSQIGQCYSMNDRQVQEKEKGIFEKLGNSKEMENLSRYINLSIEN